MKIRNRFLYRTAQRLKGIARRTRKKDVVFVAWLERLEGTACCAPYVDCTVSALTKNKVTENTTFKARIDTGADITCVPAEYAKPLMPLQLGRPVLIRSHNGRVVRAKTHKLMLPMGAGLRKAHGERRLGVYYLTVLSEPTARVLFPPMRGCGVVTYRIEARSHIQLLKQR